ncbi:hypothetical protein GCM10023185_36530 [Hymenobacter saemangeumensis]|uniref:Uncharacterized protein n=1 Tax=Hymenobacter saemangeumensis TaxID=1084522 RepID=A0ABP8IPY5_9BACT
MNTGLSPEATQTIINLGHAFNWYAYAQKKWPGLDDAGLHAEMGQMLQHLKTSAKLYLRADDNFAVNSYLHRTFHHWGSPPEAHTDYWYDMAFLYLHLYRIPVSPDYRHLLYTGWVSRPKGAAEAAAAELRQVLRRPPAAG